MKTINLQINKKLFDEVDALLMNNMVENDTFYYNFDDSSRQNIITMLWLANVWTMTGYQAWVDRGMLVVKRIPVEGV